MESYFDQIPAEIINIILSYTDYVDCFNFEFVRFEYTQNGCDWESIFSFKYHELYINIKKVLQIDRYIRKYVNYESFYDLMEYYNYNVIVKNIKQRITTVSVPVQNNYQSKDISDDNLRCVIYAVYLYCHYPNYYSNKFKIDNIARSPYTSWSFYSLCQELVFRNLQKEINKFTEDEMTLILKDEHYSPNDKFLLIILNDYPIKDIDRDLYDQLMSDYYGCYFEDYRGNPKDIMELFYVNIYHSIQ